MATRAFQESDPPPPPDPLMQMKDEIYFLAEQKQKEIDELRRLQTLRREFLAGLVNGAAFALIAGRDAGAPIG